MTRLCSNCQRKFCDGIECFVADPADHPETEETLSNLSLDDCRKLFAEQLTDCGPDPLKHLEPKIRRAA